MRSLTSLCFLLLATACSSTPSEEERQLASYQRNAGLYFEGGQFDQALGLIERGLEIAPDDYKLLSLRASIHLRQSGPASGEKHELLDQCLSEFEEVYDQREPQYHDRFLLFYYALALQKQGQRRMTEAARIDPHAEDRAERVAEKNSEADRNLLESRKMLVALLDRGEMPRLCHFHLVQIAAVMHNSPELLEHGEKFLEAAAVDQKKTLEEIDRTTVWGYEQDRKNVLQSMRGDEIGVRTLLAQHLFEKGEYESALKHVDAVLAIDPRRSDEHYNRGLILGKLGRKEEAKNDMRTFLATTSLPPDSAKVQEAVEALRQ